MESRPGLPGTGRRLEEGVLVADGGASDAEPDLSTVVVDRTADGVVATDAASGDVLSEGERPVPVAQAAYDRLAAGSQPDGPTSVAPGTESGLHRAAGRQRGILRFAARTFEFGSTFEHYGSRVRVTAPGAVFRPADGFEGYLFRVGKTGRSVLNPEGQPEALAFDHVHVDGQEQCKGVYVHYLDRSSIGSLSLLHTDGPGLYLGTACREFGLAQTYLKYRGSETDPAVYVGATKSGDVAHEGGDALNLVDFFGLVSSYFPNRNLVIESDLEESASHTRHVRFFGGQHHGYGQDHLGEYYADEPNVEIRGAKNVTFWNCHFANSAPHEPIVNVTEGPNGERNHGQLGFYGCSFVHLNEGGVGVRFGGMRGDTERRPSTPILVGNSFGANDPIPRAVDWGDGEYTVWQAANVFNATDQQFLGDRPNEGGGSLAAVDDR